MPTPTLIVVVADSNVCGAGGGGGWGGVVEFNLSEVSLLRSWRYSITVNFVTLRNTSSHSALLLV